MVVCRERLTPVSLAVYLFKPGSQVVALRGQLYLEFDDRLVEQKRVAISSSTLSANKTCRLNESLWWLKRLRASLFVLQDGFEFFHLQAVCKHDLLRNLTIA